MTYMKGYPDVIAGSWKGIAVGQVSTDDGTITTIVKRSGKHQYTGILTTVGESLQKCKFQKGEEQLWVNPIKPVGFYKGIWRRRLSDSGQPSIHEISIEMLSQDKFALKDDIGLTYFYRVKVGLDLPSESHYSTENPCDRLKENLTWLYGVEDNGRDAKSFLLNPTTDKSQVSQPIVKLNRGEIYNLRFKVVDVKPGGEFGCSLEINKGKTEGSGWVFVFENGKDRIKNGFLRLNGEYFYDNTFDVSWYKPGAFNIIVLSYCKNNELRISINNQAINRYIGTSGELAIHAIAQGLDVVFDK